MPIDASPSGTLDIENATLRSREIVALTNMVAGNDVVRSGGPALEVYGDPGPRLELVSNTAATDGTATFTRLESNVGVFSIQSGTDASTNGPITFGGFSNERMRITADGNVGVGTTNPGAPLSIFKQTTGGFSSPKYDGGGIYLSRYSDDPTNYYGGAIYSFYTNQGAGGDSGLAFKVTDGNTTNPYGSSSPNMVIVPSGSVGIGTTDPSSKLTVNEIPQHRNAYDHSLAPMTITNRIPTSDSTLNDPQDVLHLAREGTNSKAYGARATFKLSRYENSSLNSRTRLDLNLAHNSYDEPHIMTFRSDGNVGIGTTNPGAKMDIFTGSTGVAGLSLDRFESGNYRTDIYQNTYGLDFRVGYAANTPESVLYLKRFNDGSKQVEINGYVGIGYATASTYIDMGNLVHTRIISMYGSSADTSSTTYYGFGVNPSTLRYNVGSTSDVHKFYGGSTEYGYVNNGTGFVNSFTGQHKSFPHESLTGKTVDELSGLIVCASGDHISVNDDIPQRGQDGIMVSEAIPTVCLSSQMNDKTVFGVVSNVEDPESTQREDRNGAFTSTFKKIVGDTRIYVNSIGEGAVWVVNTNGSFVNGDYITTSNVVGYGQKQDSDTLKNYTVAKITMDCDFAGTLIPKKRIKKKTVTETIEEIVEEEYESNMPEEIYTYDADRDCYMKTIKDNIKTNSRPVKQEYELRDSDGNIITEVVSNTITVEEYEALENKDGYVANITEGTEITENYTRRVNKPVKYTGDKVVVKTVTHEVDDLDEHGNLQWEDHPTETETPYKIRYLDANGVETDEANAVHKAVFVGCTYHCG